MTRRPLDPQPATLWTLTRDHTVASAKVRFVPNGVEVKVTRKGKLVWSRIFETGDLALKEAEEERRRMMDDGWQITVPVSWRPRTEIKHR
jgi:hypothetical protein